ncbi:hypothetical protein KI429_00660 (plasmid) [Pseudomonas shirazica]|nr:hypothetical protein KI429_00145 [Pseudomonas shirazica]UQB76571.1 hypothetical protein KI429_00660 [Pseudomonas shirazica]
MESGLIIVLICNAVGVATVGLPAFSHRQGLCPGPMVSSYRTKRKSYLCASPEFEWEARRHQMKAADLLESFIGDLAGIQNYANKPRADRFGSNGSDERMLAENWLERAHGMKAIDPDQLSQQIEEAEEWDAQQDEWSELLGEYADRGGDPRQLLEAVDGVLTKLDELGPDFVLDLQAEVEATQTLPKLTELNPSQLAYLEKWLASNGPNNLLKWPGWHDARLGQAPKDV